jgi:DNA mismatch repair protein MSH6
MMKSVMCVEFLRRILVPLIHLLQLVFLFKLVEGAATSSFGTHVANLAGVPLEVVERAEVVSKNFAKQFKERLQLKQQQDGASRMPIVARADFAYLFKIATGQIQMPDDPVRQKLVLAMLKTTVRRYVKE